MDVLDRPVQAPLSSTRRTRIVLAVIMAVWFAIALALASADAFVPNPGSPPLRVGIAFALPIVAFVAAFVKLPAFRALVLGASPTTMAAIMGWRFVGLGFIDLYALDKLPAFFAIPAGVGDLAVAISAPLVVARLQRRDGFERSRSFVVWNLVGIADLVLALVLGVTGAMIATGAVGEISTKPLTELPLVIIPVFLVPILQMLHMSMLLGIRRTRAAR